MRELGQQACGLEWHSGKMEVHTGEEKNDTHTLEILRNIMTWGDFSNNNG